MSTNKISRHKFNDFIDKASEILTCDSKCQEEKKRVELEQKYLESKTNLLTAPSLVETSYKNYLTFAEGENAYNEYRERELESKAKTIVEAFKNNFQEEVAKAKTLLKTYTGLLLNYTHVVEFFGTLKKENALLNLEVKNTTSDLLTNDRKTYYEDQKIDNLYFYYKILLFIYLIVCGSFLIWTSVGMFRRMGAKGEPMSKRIMVPLFILFLFVMYPYFITSIFSHIFRLYDFIVSLLPKNVYKTI
jgi:hypothetical protein